MGSPSGSSEDPLLAWRTEFPIVANTTYMILARRQILVDYRPQAGIRVAPHFYTTDEELEYTASQIRSIVSAGVHA
jgi:hypothetical protein